MKYFKVICKAKRNNWSILPARTQLVTTTKLFGLFKIAPGRDISVEQSIAITTGTPDQITKFIEAGAYPFLIQNGDGSYDRAYYIDEGDGIIGQKLDAYLESCTQYGVDPETGNPIGQ